MSPIAFLYDGSRDIQVSQNRPLGAIPFKVRASSEASRVDIPRTTRTWRFQGEDGTEYRIQIQENRKPDKPT